MILNCCVLEYLLGINKFNQLNLHPFYRKIMIIMKQHIFTLGTDLKSEYESLKAFWSLGK